MTTNMNWYVVFTSPKAEKKVAERLAKNGYESYCPVQKADRTATEKKKSVSEPLVQRYVFVKASETELSSIRKVNGVFSILYWLQQPAVIPEKEIVAMREFLSEYKNVIISVLALQAPDRLRAVGHGHKDQEGYGLYVKGNSVKLTLPTLGFVMAAVVEKVNLELLTRVQLAVPNQQYPYSAAY